MGFRPLYLPLRVLFTAESFSLSSNIIVDTATLHLRYGPPNNPESYNTLFLYYLRIITENVDFSLWNIKPTIFFYPYQIHPG